MQITKQQFKESLLLCMIQIVLYSIFCINFRAISQADYHLAAISDFMIATLNFFVIKKIANNTDTLYQWIGYVTGSVIGCYIGIYLSILLK